MAEPIRVTVVRGETVEAEHRVHAVAVRDGEIVASAGDPDFVTFMRSAAKPIQALPLARAREDLDDGDLAIASASHLADPRQLEAVQALLAKAPATEGDLECGPFEGSKLKHNCSGKHAGMLALCRAEGWPTEGYRLPEHPCQQAGLAEVARLAGTDEIGNRDRRLRRRHVRAAAQPNRRGLRRHRRARRRRDARAPRADPRPRAADTNLMQAFPGWISKGGAEALLCAASPDGLSLALKVEDGTQRALRPALGAFLGRLGLDGSIFGPAQFATVRRADS